VANISGDHLFQLKKLKASPKKLCVIVKLW
jgi:hypothetical protein